MTYATRFLLSITLSVALQSAHAETAPKPKADGPEKKESPRRRVQDVFDYTKPIIFQDDFRSGAIARWNPSENDQYGLAEVSPERIKVVDAPGLGAGRKAVRFVVPRAANSFRSEIALPHENGFQERWYAGRILIPDEWVFDPVGGSDIVMQWHAIPGNWRATFPNLDISVNNESWCIQQSFGSPQTQPTRTKLKLAEPVRRGAWVSWVIHARWSPNQEGQVQIWKDGQLVMDRKGPNVYGTIGVEYTPYLKTGIYHPQWKAPDEAARAAFEKRPVVATKKIVYVTDIKVGDERAKVEDLQPPAAAPKP